MTIDDTDSVRWRRPLPGGLTRLEVLQRRHVIRRAVRDYLDGEGFVQIDAPLLVRGTTPDPAVESFAVGDRYLATSTEYQLKRLAVGGVEKLYSLTQNFRADDASGSFRNPEFTMLEWGRVGEDMRVIETDAEALTLAAVHALGLPETITYQGRAVDLCRPWQRLSVAEAVERYAGVSMPDFEAASCRRAAEAAGLEIRAAWAEDKDFLFSVLMDHLQPKLGVERPVFLCDWPLYQTTSAKAENDKATAERSELFIAGIELSDGFAGLADADMQEMFFTYALEARRQTGQSAIRLDGKYLAAMRSGAVQGAGMALGFDRLTMLLTDQPHIANVLAFGWAEL
jgi:elongation factor P--(R)-beta-lysine ligase